MEVRLIKFALLSGIGYAPMTAFAIVLMRWNTPCNSSTFGYFLIPECTNDSGISDKWPMTSVIQLGFICALAFWFTVDGNGSFAVFLMDFSFVQAYCYRRYVQYVTKLLVKKPNEAVNILPYYRQLEILSRYYNVIQQDGLIITNVFLMMLGLIISSYPIISLGLKMSLPQLMFFLTCAQDASVILFMYTTILGQLYRASLQVKECVNERMLLNGEISNVKKKWIGRYIKSFRPLKSYIGYVNYVEQLTPLVMQDTCINQIVSLLLLE